MLNGNTPLGRFSHVPNHRFIAINIYEIGRPRENLNFVWKRKLCKEFILLLNNFLLYHVWNTSYWNYNLISCLQITYKHFYKFVEWVDMNLNLQNATSQDALTKSNSNQAYVQYSVWRQDKYFSIYFQNKPYICLRIQLVLFLEWNIQKITLWTRFKNKAKFY